MLHREVYERTSQFEERVSGARLRTYEWQFLASLDGQATVGELVRRLKIDEPTIAEFIAEQERNGAIAPRLISFEEFLNSTEAEAPPEMRREPEPPPRASTASQLKRTAAEELRAIARLSIAAAIGEILTLISKRRTGGSAPSSPAKPATPAPSTRYDAQSFAASAPPDVIVPAAPAPPAPPAAAPQAPRDSMSELRYDRDDLASFQVFDWTLPAPPRTEAADLESSLPPADAGSNGVPLREVEPLFDRDFETGDIEYLQALAEDEPVVFEDGLTIADRLLRDYGPIDATEAAPSADFAPYVEPAPYTESTPYADASATDGAAHTFEPSAHTFEPSPYVFEADPFTATPSPEPQPYGFEAEAFREQQAVEPEPQPYLVDHQSLTAEPQSFTAEHQSFMSELAPPVVEPPAYSPIYTPHSVEAVPARAEEPSEFERDPQRVAFSVNDLSGYVERVDELPVEQPAQAAEHAEHTEATDPSNADPIVFSLSARNPDSFWSGKK